MGPDLIKKWEERKRFADDVWKAKGLKGGEGSPQYAKQGMDAYRNLTEPREGWGDLEEGAIQRVPITFSAMNTMEATLLARDPQFSVFARNQESVEAAPLVETILNYYVYELRMRRQWRRALKDANVVAGFGLVWHGYTPAIRKVKLNRAGEPQRLIETYDPALADVPWVRRVAPWDVRIDPTGSSFHPDEDAEWAMRRFLLSPERFADDPMFARINVEPTYSHGYRAQHPHLKEAGDQGPDIIQRLEIWEVYDKVNEIMFHVSPGAEGKILTRDGERPWPEGVPKEGLPYSYLAFNEQCDDPFPISYESMIRELNVELNKLRTMMAELTKRLRRLVLIDRDRLEEGEAENIVEECGLKEFVYAKGGSLDHVIAEVALGTFPQELVFYEARIIETIRETLGQSKFQRAQRENVESATEAHRIGMGDDAQVGRNQEAMETFITDTVRKWFQGLRQTATDDLLVPILGEEDARQLEAAANAPFLRASPKQIRGEFDFRIRLGSSRPSNEQQEKQEAIALLQMMEPFGERVVIDQHLIDLYRAFNKSPRRYLLNQRERTLTGAGQPKLEEGKGNSQQAINPNILAAFGGGVQ